VRPGLAAKIAKPVVFYPLCCPPLNIFETVSDIVRQMRYCAFTTRRILERLGFCERISPGLGVNETLYH
jgi:hypothetical protein